MDARHELKKPHIVKLFLLRSLQQIAAPLSITKIFNSFKSEGRVIGKNSLYEYLGYFEEAYALFSVPVFNFSENTRQTTPKKVYTVDPGLISAFSIKPEFDKGTNFENIVFNHLRSHFSEIFCYKTRNKKEVDFIVLTPQGTYSIYQVSLNISSVATRKRELDALFEASQELKSLRVF